MARRTYNTRYKHELSPRQREVLELVGRGHTNLQIAERLGITLDGAKYHVSEILAKLQVGTREEAAAMWREERKLSNRLRERVRAFAGVRPLTIAGFAGGAACMAAAALLYLPGWIEREPAAAPACSPAFVSLSARTGLGNKSSSATVQLQAQGFQGPSCVLATTAVVTFSDMAGNALPIDGNGLTAPIYGEFEWSHVVISADHQRIDITPIADPDDAETYTPVAYDDRLSLIGGTDFKRTPYLYWTNWCGDYRDGVTVRVNGRAFGDLEPAYISNPPRCDDATKPSTVRLAYR